jgi:hypothetical protein
METYLNKIVLNIACFGLFIFSSCNDLPEDAEGGQGGYEYP